MNAPTKAAGAQDLPDIGTSEIDAAYSKIRWRLMPLLFVAYVLANIDRINIGIAQLQMKTALGFSDAVYGAGAGIFFIAYFMFEVPSSLLMNRIGVRRTLARITIGWGIVSAATMMVNSVPAFYALRFLLGVFEAGFFPGVVYYLTLWYPAARRAKALAAISSALVLAGVIGNPLSGWILKNMDAVAGLAGWQWMFLLEGLPSVGLGLVILFALPEGPHAARWLTPRQKALVAQEVEAQGSTHVAGSVRDVLKDRRVYAFAAVYFSFICAIAVIPFWLPTIIKGLGVTDLARIGLYAAIPNVVAAVAMFACAASSDRIGERRWHTSIAAMVGAAALMMLPMASSQVALSFVLLCFAAAGIFSTVPLFWAIPSAWLSGSAGAASGIALISSIGLLGGFVSPTVIGWLKTTTGSMATGLYVFSGLFAFGAILLLVITKTERAGAQAGR
ncbi:Putative metabolite transport protein NicT [Paraburkholderia hiiakae]|uniref:Metabolite transport protein NicT n=1 Tax=Paraburkholderia hiiakae TaxID=1081782 RepID=A0ABM8P9P1_9BURK|nr:MFS transporter [Paraburkholderia hiiakae]CAD6560056.1 Putative metabolite transport protein NicT [Paraburkholderia hiiakae]